MKSKHFLESAAAVLLLCNTQLAHADIVNSYSVVETFYEPAYAGYSNSVFVGTFDYDVTTGTISNLAGQLSEAMTGCDSAGMGCKTIIPQTELTLSYQLASNSDGHGGILASVFQLDSTAMYTNGAYDTSASSNPNQTLPANAYVTLDLTAAQLAGTSSNLTSSLLTNLYYGDCNPGGMMGTICMTGWGKAAGPNGSMGGYPISEVVTVTGTNISAVPLPPAAWSFIAGIMGMLAMGRRKQFI